MIKTIEVCDICKKETEDLEHYIFPWFKEAVAEGGNGFQQITYSTPCAKNYVVCRKCANEMRRKKLADMKTLYPGAEIRVVENIEYI